MIEEYPKPPIPEESLKIEVLKAYKRHLKRAQGNKQEAWDMTFWHLKHMEYTDQEWGFIQKIIIVMKTELEK